MVGSRSLALRRSNLRRMAEAALAADMPVLLAATTVYMATLAPGVLGLDSGELVTGAYTLGIVHPTGYPLYLLLAKAFTFLPLGTIAFRVNLLSAVSGGLAVWLVARLGYRLTLSRPAAWAAAGLLAFAISFWRMAVIAEVYTLHALFLAGTLLLLERWLATGQERWIAWLGLVYGLSLANHVSGALFAPAVACLFLRDGAWRRIPRRATLLLFPFALGLLPYLYLPLRYAANPPLNYVNEYYSVDLRGLSGLWWMVSGQAYWFFTGVYSPQGYLHEILSFGEQLLRNFTALGVALGVLGWVEFSRRHSRLALVTALIFALNVAFYAGYAVSDKATMFLPAYVIWALWISSGLATILRWVERASVLKADERNLLARLALAGLVAVVALTCVGNWRWADMSNAVEPEDFARQALASVAPNAMIVGEWSTAVILEYYQLVEGLRPDVLVFNQSRYEVARYYEFWRSSVPHAEAVARIGDIERDMMEEASAIRPLYVLEYDPLLVSDYQVQPVGNLFRLLPRTNASS